MTEHEVVLFHCLKCSRTTLPRSGSIDQCWRCKSRKVKRITVRFNPSRSKKSITITQSGETILPVSKSLKALIDEHGESGVVKIVRSALSESKSESESESKSEPEIVEDEYLREIFTIVRETFDRTGSISSTEDKAKLLFVRHRFKLESVYGIKTVRTLLRRAGF